jgi:hypothetical protein
MAIGIADKIWTEAEILRFPVYPARQNQGLR